MVPTAQLRFIFRQGTDRPMRILQQKWIAWHSPGDPPPLPNEIEAQGAEWRDVPLVEDK